MKCPKCKSKQIAIVDSRASDATHRRRRCCLDCRHRWTTREVDDEVYQHKVLPRSVEARLLNTIQLFEERIAEIKRDLQHPYPTRTT